MESGLVVSVAVQPATPRGRLWTIAAIAVLLVAFCAAATVARIRVPEAVGFVPATQGMIFVTDLTTAALLFTQVSLIRARGLLVLANAYLFTALIVVVHTLTFPGAFAPRGLLGAGPQTTGWLHIIWHFSFPAAVVLYASLKDAKNKIGISARLIIYGSVTGMVVLICAILWGVTAIDEFLPPLFLDRQTFSPFVFYTGAFDTIICGIAFWRLTTRKTSVLDEWLTISVAATTAEMAMVTFFSSGRYDIGWYSVRLFSLVSSTAVFLALLTENTRLYARISTALWALKRERDNKLLSAQAAAATLAHEIRQPLALMMLNVEAGMRFLRKTPPDLEATRQHLEMTLQDCQHLNETIEAIRSLFRKMDQPEQLVDLNEVILAVLKSQQDELARRSIKVRRELTPGLSLVYGYEAQLEEVIVNLVSNASDAMGMMSRENRVLTVRTRPRGRDAVSVDILDTGPGIDPKRLGEIFDAFVTTKPHGSGLGLAICRRIIEYHGGELTASSDGQSGAEFHILLPARRQSGSVREEGIGAKVDLDGVTPAPGGLA